MKKAVLLMVISGLVSCSKIENKSLELDTSSPTIKAMNALPVLLVKKEKDVPHLKTVNINNKRAAILKGEVEEYNVQAIINQFKAFAVESSEPVYLIINSPGGSVTDGYELVNTIQAIKSTHKVDTICEIESEAASMASIIALWCTKTYIHKRAFMMFHEASFQLAGSQSQVKTRSQFFDKYLDDLNTEIAAKLGLTLAEYRIKIAPELWMTANEAVKAGAADAVVDEIFYTVTPAPKPQGMSFLFGKNKGEAVINPLRTTPNEESSKK